MTSRINVKIQKKGDGDENQTGNITKTTWKDGIGKNRHVNTQDKAVEKMVFACHLEGIRKS